ncbi:MAG: phage portal protein [Deltaproteobacteria bacterium]|nr:phage portal protein [Deltaproteobacteria bacterium]
MVKTKPSFRKIRKPIAEAVHGMIDVDTLASFVGGESSTWTGDKFLGGFGITKDYDVVDHTLLRRRSKQLFTENLYARGLIRRLITNEINKGLSLEATPDADILDIDPSDLAEWSEITERRYMIWGKNPDLCDYRQSRTFGALQRQARLMALVSGDVLVVLRQGSTGLPTVDLVDAEHVSTPLSDTMIRAVHNRGNTVVNGVEIDSAKRHVAFFVLQSNGTWRRITAKGSRTGRKQAWLLYGTERLIDDVRGQSILALIMQSLKEVDRYRDAEQRSAVVNSMIAMWVEKTEDKLGTLPMTGGATRRDTVTTQDDSNGRKDIEFSSNMPGMMLQELQHGEKPTSYDTKRPNVNFGVFEAAILSAIAWANEVPPETLLLQFQNNYSASRGATNEFKMYLDRVRTGFGEEFTTPIYQDWLISEVLNQNITADGLLQAWRTPAMWDIFGAWMLSDWAGAIKPNVDLLKEVKAYKELVDEGYITRDRGSRELTGMKYSKVVQQLFRENTELVKAKQPLLDAGFTKNENPELTETMDEEQNNG